MAHSFCLFNNRLMSLIMPVLVVYGKGRSVRKCLFVSFRTSGVQKKLSQLKVLFIPRDTVKLDESDLYLLMTREPLSFPRPELATDKICTLDSHIQEAPLPGRKVVSNCSLIHMPYVVELVTRTEVGPSFFAGTGSRIL